MWNIGKEEIEKSLVCIRNVRKKDIEKLVLCEKSERKILRNFAHQKFWKRMI